ncbi:MAG TPA: Gfo/Idh/MocA family oxidoreductase [Planctomycetota bacterium]|nr:Gfo/Idh/MocA family oxidoreductase [Planctomycetota bacterium]
MTRRPTGIGIIGLGFMGRTHLAAFQGANAMGLSNRLVAVSDADPERRAGRAAEGGNFDTGAKRELLFDPRNVRASEDPRAVIDDPEVELVSICTPTTSHVELALAALAAGKHVLVEKPVGLASAEVKRLADAASRSERLCMPAMCMRFWPGWDWLREHIRRATFGPVRSAVFSRLGTRPAWNPSFYQDPRQSGGALFDLHIHDADFVRWCFGEPTSVSSSGSLDHITTLYRFQDGPPHVVAEGGWDHTSGFAFRMRYIVVFEHATAEFDFNRAPRLVLSRNGTSEAVELPQHSGYDGEIRHLLAMIARGERDLVATMAEAVALTRMLESERASLA